MEKAAMEKAIVARVAEALTSILTAIPEAVCSDCQANTTRADLVRITDAAGRDWDVCRSCAEAEQKAVENGAAPHGWCGGAQ